MDFRIFDIPPVYRKTVRRAEHCPTAFPADIADFGFSAPDASVPIRLALDDRLSLNENTSDGGHVAAKSGRIDLPVLRPLAQFALNVAVHRS